MIPTEEQQKDHALILNLSEREKIALDAYLFNPSNKVEAYKVARNIINDSSIDEEVLKNRANGWINQKGSKAYLTLQKSKITTISQTQLLDNENFEGLNKAQTAKILQEIILTTTDHKLKADCTLKYADLMGFKKDKVEKEEKRVRYYLPVKCSFCEFFKKNSVPQEEQSTE